MLADRGESMFFMYVTCLEQQSFCHALRKNLKFKLLYFKTKNAILLKTTKPMEI